MRTQSIFPRSEAHIVAGPVPPPPAPAPAIETAAAKLRADEALKFAECEEVIERGMETFLEVGGALLAIREGRLYRERFGTFEEYCQKRWEMTARRARQLCAATEVVHRIADQPRYDFPHVAEGNGNSSAEFPELDMRVLQAAKFFVGRSIGLSHLMREFNWPREEAASVFDAMIDRGILRDGVVYEVEEAMSNGTAPEPDLPKSERVARPFSQLPKEEQAKAWDEFADSNPEDKRTARAAEDFVAERQGKKPREIEVPTELYKLVEGSCCADVISLHHTAPDYQKGIRPPFDWDNGMWIAVGLSCGGDGVREAECHQLIGDGDGKAIEEGLVRAHVMPHEPGAGYEGIGVIWKREKYRLGPKVIFRPAAAEEQEEFGLAGESVEAAAESEVVEPRIEGLAKKLYGIGMTAIKSATRWKEMSVGHRTAWFAIAKWHVDEVQKLEDLIEKLNKTIGEQSREITALSRFPEVKPRKALEKLQKAARARWDAAKAKKKNPIANYFLICRKAFGGNPTRFSTAGGWTNNPAKALHFATRKEAEKRKAFGNHNNDNVITVAEAEKLATK